MEASKAAGGGREDDININMADNNNGMHCSDHPYRTNPGGICAFCLQDKLGKLVSSSLPLPIAPSSHSSSSPSFPSQTPPPSSLINNAATTTTTTTHHKRLPFLLAKKKKKKATPSSSSSSETDNIIFKRSKSTATPRRGIGIGIDDYSPRRKNGFWSFLYLSSKSSASATKLVALNGNKHKEKCLGGSSVGRKFEIDNNTQNSVSTSVSASASAFERKVSRSRSVGCGSRSFSGDFFERISTGLGDCTLRRVESQREGKSKAAAALAGAAVSHHHQCMKERVKCAGLFGGFMMTTTSSSSSSSSSSYLVSSSSAGGDDHHHHHHHHHQMNGRARSWGWAFASPMRAFGTKPNSSSKENNIITKASSSSSDHNNASTTTTPNLSDLPSFLAIRV